jgi:acyl-CoA thioesterase-1
MVSGCAVAPFTHLPIYPYTFFRSALRATRSAHSCVHATTQPTIFLIFDLKKGIPMKTFMQIFIMLSFSARIILAQPGPLRVACIGNSITHGGGGDASYPAQLGDLLGDHYEVRNFGVDGTTLLKKGDFPYWNESALDRAIEYDPHIIIILLGTNDSKPQNWIYRLEFIPDYFDFVEAFRTGGADPQIYVCNPTPVFAEGLEIDARVIREEILPLMDFIRSNTHTCSIDFYQGMLEHGDLFPDAIHPNSAGYGLMAGIAADSIHVGPAGYIRNFSYWPEIAEQGDSVTIYWEATAGSEVKLGNMPVAEFDSTRIVLNDKSTLTLTASGVVRDTSQITIPYLPPGNVKSFQAFPPMLDKGSGDSSILSWSGSKGSELYLDGIPVSNPGNTVVAPQTTTVYTLIAAGANLDTAIVTIQVLASDSINRALSRPVTVSSTERGFTPESAVDGNLFTWWQSEGTGTEWINVDLGKEFEIHKIHIDWGENFATQYQIQGTDESSNTITLYSDNSGDGGTDLITGLNGKARFIKLLCITNNGNGVAVKELEVYYTPGQTTVSQELLDQPSDFALSQNYPNPFNESTSILFSLPVDGMVLLKIINSSGQEMTTLINEFKNSGTYRVCWNAEGYSSGIYLVRLQTANRTIGRKMILLK